MTPTQAPGEKIYFSIDRGGTFTDIYASLGRRVFTEKLLSSDPANYRDAPSERIRRILKRVTGESIPPGKIPTRDIGWIRMGTTVATNALLERKGTACALAVTRGFGDLLRIGYQNRPELFALHIVRPQPIYKQVVEIEERVRPVAEDDRPGNGRIRSGIGGEKFLVLEEPDADAVRVRLRQVYDSGIRSLAVVLMRSYSFPYHERLIGDIAAGIGFRHVSLSHEVMARIRIVGRGDTTSIDAYLTPHIKDYLENFRAGFQDRLQSTPLFFMQSDGGLAESSTFRGYNAILSGPAGGVVGYAMAASR
jgi:5-oxoprolinase (ATP-hydrolysing)